MTGTFRRIRVIYVKNDIATIAKGSGIFKLVLAGDGGVGKSTLALRVITGAFHEIAKITIGVDVHVKKMDVNGVHVTLQIWDFGGEDRFRFLLPRYTQQADGALFIYDVTNLMSLLHLSDWMAVLRAHHRDFPVLGVGTKVDLVEKRKVSREEAEQQAKNFQITGLMEVSSKTGQGVEEVFETIGKLMLEQRDTRVAFGEK